MDAEFKLLMDQFTGVVFVVPACTRSGLVDKLADMRDELAGCERSLAEYLESKRRMFPRFYFISSSDLLELLSKGNTPRAILKHLIKLTDSIYSLNLQGTRLSSTHGCFEGGARGRS